MWRQLQVIAGNKRPIRPPHPDPAREAERLASSFATRTCTDNLPAETCDRLTELLPARNDQVDRACEDQSNTNTSLTLLELRRALKTSGDTSPGADRITYSMIINAGSDGHSALLTLFNASWEACKLPSKWKEATIVPIPKPKNPGAMRPISLLSCVGKTMERIVLNRLTWAVGPLHQDLFAYRRGMGTTECLSTLLCAASSGGTTVAFFDLEKAFELANCRVILSLLVRKGVCGRLLIWLKDFLSGRAARVAFQGETSQLHQHENGTPQGSILSPFLFNILMEELISLPLPPGTKLLCYADDLALTGPAHAQRAQNLLTDITTKCRELGLKLNVAKSKAMAFGCDAPRAPLYILDTPLSWVTSHQYLGI
ncbi:putative RNA-directed DNA polymerase from transposon X-element [Chionoecetes opilio]|uniref:Putative RNA-directed DNA polymerase from transposon X-element n=1 Tax=Chionoecetes opilio TaxID=41210 RepID=A0A8J4YHP5_CHIOP|nr:putative RNA-directed DNA polymerase from transposon X-element [Chionoecetes opilio]